MSSEIKQVLDLIEAQEKMVAMVAPSFPVDFSESEIAGQLKELGFAHVVEVSIGAVETNRQINELIQNNPDQKYITNPCPGVVRLIRNKYPGLISFLTNVDSPMAATARIMAKRHPGHQKVYIGPCPLKKLEAREDYPQLDIIVLTYLELAEILKLKKSSTNKKEKTSFESFGSETRLYPISGGLAQSSGISKKLTDPEYDVVSGPKLLEETLAKFKHNKELKVLDALYCAGGCINGIGITNRSNLTERRKKIIDYWQRGL